MAAPNIVNVTAIYGKTAVQAITTSATAIISNSAGSNQVLKVDTLMVANVNGSTTASVTVELYRSSTAYRITFQTVVPAGGTIDVLNNYVYLEEGDSLRLTASANSYLEAVASYETIS